MDTTPGGTAIAASGTAIASALPAGLTLGPTRISVTDLDSSVRWYVRSLGLVERDRSGAVAQLASEAGPVVLELEHAPDGRPAGRHAGLYHIALLHPDRAELSFALRRIVATRTPVQGMSDHHTHDAIYLPDPDGNGLELAADRPREEWPDTAKDPVSSRPDPLDVEALLAETAGRDVPRRARGIVTGHLHLHVSSIEDGLAFYRDVVGFELRMRMESAAFVAAGGYHHHLGFNVWKGNDVPPLPDDAIGLRHWTMQLPSAADLAALEARVGAVLPGSVERAGDRLVLTDPWNMRLEVTAAA